MVAEILLFLRSGRLLWLLRGDLEFLRRIRNTDLLEDGYHLGKLLVGLILGEYSGLYPVIGHLLKNLRKFFSGWLWLRNSAEKQLRGATQVACFCRIFTRNGDHQVVAIGDHFCSGDTHAVHTAFQNAARLAQLLGSGLVTLWHQRDAGTALQINAELRGGGLISREHHQGEYADKDHEEECKNSLGPGDLAPLFATRALRRHCIVLL